MGISWVSRMRGMKSAWIVRRAPAIILRGYEVVFA